MSITEDGRLGETVARMILKEKFKVKNIFQADWLITHNGAWFVVEVKYKEPFTPPPFEGMGLDLRQVQMRLKFYEETGIRCIFLVIDKNTSFVYWNYLDELEALPEYPNEANKENAGKFTTRNNIRIYSYKYFKPVWGADEIVKCELKGREIDAIVGKAKSAFCA